MKKELQKVYLHSLRKRRYKLERLQTADSGDNRVIESHDCREIDVSKDIKKVRCTVVYSTRFGRNEKLVEIGSEFIPKMRSKKPEDIREIDKAVETEFRKLN